MGVIRARTLGGGARVRPHSSNRNTMSAQGVLFLPVKREAAPDAQRADVRNLNDDLYRTVGGSNAVR